MQFDIKSFKIEVSDSDLADLRRRLQAARWPGQIPGTGWKYGADETYLRELIEYWRDGFDWRRAEAKLNEWPQFTTTIDGEELHYAHIRGKGPRPRPLILTHGWPSSFFEWSRLAPLLSDPAAHGGRAEDAFDLVIPSLPGYGFSAIPARQGVSPPVIARRFVQLMERLGYHRYFAHGTDYGARISAYQAWFAPDRVAAWHTTLVPTLLFPPSVKAVANLDDDTPDGRERAVRHEGWYRNEIAYTRIQGTKPQSLAYGLNDSPIGLAAWITEKWRSWSDCGFDIESRFTKDDLLTNIAIYWFTSTINSSMRLYYESDHDMVTLEEGERIIPPVGFALESPTRGRPRDPLDTPRLSPPARETCEQVFDVARYRMMSSGGHFMALEEPVALADEIRSFFRKYRDDMAWA